MRFFLISLCFAIGISCKQYDNVQYVDENFVFSAKEKKEDILKKRSYGEIYLKGSKPLYGYKVRDGVKIMKVVFNQNGKFSGFNTIPGKSELDLKTKYYYDDKVLKRIEYFSEGEKLGEFKMEYTYGLLNRMYQENADEGIVSIVDIKVSDNTLIKSYSQPKNKHLVKEIFRIEKETEEKIHYDNSSLIGLLTPVLGNIKLVKIKTFIDGHPTRESAKSLVKKYFK